MGTRPFICGNTASTSLLFWTWALELRMGNGSRQSAEMRKDPPKPGVNASSDRIRMLSRSRVGF